MIPTSEVIIGIFGSLVVVIRIILSGQIPVGKRIWFEQRAPARTLEGALLFFFFFSLTLLAFTRKSHRDYGSSRAGEDPRL